jgi:RimJ/RimL family protein N-acetyltransferase
MSYAIIDNGLKRCQDWVANEYGVCGTEFTAAIGLERDGELVSVTGYNHFNGKSCHVHYFLKKGAYVPRRYVWFVHYYPYIQNGLNMMIAIVSSTNIAIIRLAKNLGYSYNYTIDNADMNGDLVIYTMTRDRCRFLGGRYA